MSLIGCIDTLTDTCLTGWAADDADSGKPVQVDVVINSALVATVPCDQFRQDLLAAGIGDGRKSFSFDPSAHLRVGRNSLEVRYSGTDRVVRKGRGCWVRRRGGISESQAALLAALEAYHEFKPEDHVCGIGEGAAELERVFIEAGMAFRKFTSLEAPGDGPAMRLEEKADVVVAWAWSEPPLEVVRTLKQFARDYARQPGVMAIGFADGREAGGQIRQAFQECGAPDINLESIAAAQGGRQWAFAFTEAGSDGTRGAAAPPVLAHIHVPKCAGTSLRVLLETHRGPRHLGLYVNDSYFVYGEETLRSYLLQDSEMQGFSSHHVRSFPRWLAGREMLYVTFLREPIQQFVSYMTHIKKHYASITAKTLLEAVPPDAPEVTLREFARWLLTADRDVPFRENHNVNFFSRHSGREAGDRLAAAKATLGEFFFVGITERMEESMSKLKALTRDAGLEFPPDPIPVENTSADYRDDLAWIEPEDEVGSLLLQSVEEDRRLYDWAAARL